MENPIFDELSFQIFEKRKSSKIVSFRKSKNPQIQKVEVEVEAEEAHDPFRIQYPFRIQDPFRIQVPLLAKTICYPNPWW